MEGNLNSSENNAELSERLQKQFMTSFNKFKGDIKKQSNEAIEYLKTTRALVLNAVQQKQPNINAEGNSYTYLIDQCIQSLQKGLKSIESGVSKENIEDQYSSVDISREDGITSYLQWIVPNNIQYYKQTLSEQFSSFQNTYHINTHQDFNKILKSINGYNESLDKLQVVLEGFVEYAATGKELDQKKAQGMLDQVKEVFKFVLDNFKGFITAIKDFFDKVQEKVFGIPRARLEDTPQGLDQGKENEQSNNSNFTKKFKAKENYVY